MLAEESNLEIPDKQKIGILVAYFRKILNLDQKYLAERVGITRKTLSLLESGGTSKKISKNTVIAILSTLLILNENSREENPLTLLFDKKEIQKDIHDFLIRIIDLDISEYNEMYENV